MSCRTLIGTTGPGGTYTARWLHWGDRPDRLIPVLRQIWQHTFARDAEAMLAVLLASDWCRLGINERRPRGDRTLELRRGVGLALGGDSAGPRTRPLTGEVGPDLEWLYLITATTGTVTVYEATRHDRWLRHGSHLLEPADELFAPYEGTQCLSCGAIAEVDYQEMPSMLGYGHDVSFRCGHCGASETADPLFGSRPTRSGWSAIDR